MVYQQSGHGSYLIDRSHYDERIHLVRMCGAWNMLTAHALVDEQLQLVKDHLMDKPWAGIADMRRWELGSPELVEFFHEGVHQLIGLNLRVHAILPNIELKQMQKMVAREYTVGIGDSQLKVRYFEDEQEAIAWCRDELARLNYDTLRRD
ncbi:hypothetical protein [Dongshaea marina]|uniref:hypothetical protein n=1 Tax=Dongshaea marina TaxID=2047966 RepID=UPI000D3EC8A4|nr:hypothetical protein [Dongshaea marina]